MWAPSGGRSRRCVTGNGHKMMTDRMWDWYMLVAVVAIGLCLAAVVATSVILAW